MTSTLRTGAGVRVDAGRTLAQGGQGEVLQVATPRGVVLKRFFPKVLTDDPELEARVRAMVGSPPPGWRDEAGHVAIAWATDTVYDGGAFVGLLMPAVTTHAAIELHQVANPSDRARSSGFVSDFTWRYLVATARNLAGVVHTLHSGGVVIGDFNERNVLVWSDAQVTVLDCDSMQIRDAKTGERYLCRVGRPEFTPPELHHADWSKTVRSKSSDLFALAIHIHQLLLEGEHPFRGEWHGVGDKPAVPALARQGLWTHAGGSSLGPRPSAVPIKILPPEIVALFHRAFVDGAVNPRQRPTAKQWHTALAKVASSLSTCRRDTRHVYASHIKACPWCTHRAVTTARITTRAAAARASAPAQQGTVPPRTLHTPVQSAPVSLPVQPLPVTATRPPSRAQPRRGRRALVAAGVLAVMVGGLVMATRGSGGSTELSVSDVPACSDVIASVSASNTAPDGIDAAGDAVSYAAANLLDRDPTTAWRVAGLGVGEIVSVTFEQACTLTTVGVLNGYQKVDVNDGTDRWAQNRRVASATWQIAGSSYVQQFDVRTRGEPDVRPVDRRVVSGFDLTITGSGPAETERDFTAISEILFS